MVCTEVIPSLSAHEDLVHIMEMRTELGSITGALEELHNDIEHDKEGIGKIKQLIIAKTILPNPYFPQHIRCKNSCN